MSFQAMTWATSRELPCNQKMVLLMLANRTNHDTGRCDPSHSRLAADCGLSVSAVKSAIGQLAEAGYITINHRKSGNINLPNQYTLCIEGGGSSENPGVGRQKTHPSRETTEGVGREKATNQEDFNQEDKLGGDSAPRKPKRSAPSKHLTDDFQPNDTNRKVAAESGVSIANELPQFIDHHIGKGTTMKDWHRAFNTWLRRAKGYQTAGRAEPVRASQKDFQL